ncbi:MAG TPA: ribosome maturation factor RimP [Burkholderiales bacterium]|jgi:ribosome maturation factor RimP|nr:ribosome maturation factor RimP [Burkholderiales bacterium]
MAIAAVVETTLAGMGFELVDAQVSNHGRLLRIFIDRPGGITVDHCADVSRQLSHVLAVEGIDYDRLEVSSPGLDRPLRKLADFERFTGQKAEVRMRVADQTGRRKYAGAILGAAQGKVRLQVEDREVELDLGGMDRAKLIPEL